MFGLCYFLEISGLCGFGGVCRFAGKYGGGMKREMGGAARRLRG